VLVPGLLAALSACGTLRGSVPPATPTATTGLPTQSVRFTTADGITLEGSLHGHGTVAVILSNGGDNVSEPWRPLAEQLAAHGYLVLSYAYRPRGPTFDGLADHALTDLRGAIAFMRTQPLIKLILMGASLGALVSLKVAAGAPCDGLVALSSPLGYQDVQLADTDLRRLRMPKLFVTSQDNPPFTGDTLHLFDVSPAPKDKRVYPGGAHGTDLLAGTAGADLQSALLSFVLRYVPAR
jgi:pimeloyl-ACP methyl ester carboxylesterase